MENTHYLEKIINMYKQCIYDNDKHNKCNTFALLYMEALNIYETDNKRNSLCIEYKNCLSNYGKDNNKCKDIAVSLIETFKITHSD
jgi:predicted DNA-binding protein YlxM (UPF0122 family)